MQRPETRGWPSTRVGVVGEAAHVLAWLARSADLFSSASVLSRFCSMMSTFCCLHRRGGRGVAGARENGGCRHRRGEERRAHDTLDLIDLPLHVVDVRGGARHLRVGSSAVAARAKFAMNGRAPVGSRLAAGPSAYIIHVSRRAAAWRRARLPSARAWLNKRPAARGAPATACCPVAGRRGALLPTSLALSCPHYQPHPL